MATSDPHSVRRRSAWLEAAHLAVLCSFAVMQPLFDILGRDADFFVARRSQPVDLWFLALGPTLALPLILLGISGLGRLFARALGNSLHLIFVGGLFALMLVPPLRTQVHAPAPLLFGGALLAGAVFATLYARWTPASSLLTVLTPAPLILAGLFLFATPVARMLARESVGTATGVAITDPHPVVLVILDELPVSSLLDPRGDVDATLFPAFAELAASSTWFRNFTANHTSTTDVLPVLLTGRLPADDERLPVVSDHPRNLFTLLGGRYRLNVWETRTSLCPSDLILAGPGAVPALADRLSALGEDLGIVFAHIVLPERWSRDLPSITRTWGDFAGGGVTDGATDGVTGGATGGATNEELDAAPGHGRRNARAHVFRSFIDSLVPQDEPTLSFLHVTLPHVPWAYTRSGLLYDQDNLRGQLTPRDRWRTHEHVTDLALQRHLLQLAFVDELLGEMIERLKRSGAWDRSLVVVLADHGASFRPGQARREPDAGNAREIMHVPLFVKRPGQTTPLRDDRNVESIDLVPTVVDVLGVAPPWSMDGHSAFDGDGPPRPTKVIHRPRLAPLVLDDVRLPERWPAAERRHALFGADATGDDIERWSPRPKHVGRTVAMLSDGATVPAVFELVNRDHYDRVDRTTGLLPLYVRGTVESVDASAPPPLLAIVVDGTVAAVAWTFDRVDARARFAALLPEAALPDGRRRLEVMAVLPNGRLASMDARSFRFAPATSGSPERFVRSDGAIFPVRDAPSPGRVNAAELEDGRLELRGWATDPEGRQPAEQILVTLRDHAAVFTALTGRSTRALRERHGHLHPLATAAFRLSLGLESVGGDVSGRVRVFALSDASVTELDLRPAAAWISPP